jgi:hypothetical protein
VGKKSEKCEILSELTKQYGRSNAVGTQLRVRLNPPPETDTSPDPVGHFLASMNDLFDHTLRNVRDGDMIGVVVHNE